jgi:hypothetical protein
VHILGIFKKNMLYTFQFMKKVLVKMDSKNWFSQKILLKILAQFFFFNIQMLIKKKLYV